MTKKLRNKLFDFTQSIIVIPAYNEEKWIGNTIDLIHQTGLKIPVLVVSDGSRDRTAQIARERGCQVIELSQNVGKAEALFVGLKHVVSTKRAPSSILALDADLTLIPKHTLETMVKVVAKSASQNRAVMAVARYSEPNVHMVDIHNEFELSGIRSFSFQAVKKLLSSKQRQLAKGFGLEIFLNDFFRKQTVYLHSSSALEGRSAMYGFAGPSQGIQLDRMRKVVTRLQEQRHARERLLKPPPRKRRIK